MKKMDTLKTGLRASWRIMLVSLLRVTNRVQAGLDARVRKLPAR